eukprot:CAMPEP_0177225802 /NCGR_PEP_ID=MMETSP0367-20130122/39740_1 /TAXON_ID=447022 ORGANISM="Scrippsiella hangoei-like, Strain SHHI-4" /NCGR_SAMPLE_ID=MMETSP0367 /ASSEMBLY_ACC=CAM_ASM_000362 /LENGTH=180 /DNA_ID=CAMNT_0018675919 /DNA_START=48 /DNA_END=590 /DNA_ORIENTATION=+
MTNRPPLPGTYDPKDWKCPQCKTLNFKKRMSCLACAGAKPKNMTEVTKDWRVGKKDIGENVHADWTCRLCQKFNMATAKECKHCSGPCPPKTMEAGATESGDSRAGRSAGHFDRPNPEEERNNWNSDEEDIDEFGRKKKKSSAGSDAAAKKAAAAERQKAALERLRNKGSKRGGSRSRSR